MRAYLRQRRALARGFTLVELLVAMVAGLIVALAVVGLSKEASSTFNDESRIASAEMQIRTAIDRLRADVQRAGYMSSGNLYIDPAVLSVPGTTANVAAINPIFNDHPGDMNLFTLAGVRLVSGGSASTLAAANGLDPDMIELAGNFTGTEELGIGAGGEVAVSPASAGLGCGGQRIYLNVKSSPAIWRLAGLGVLAADAGGGDAGGASAYADALENAFAPVNAFVPGAGTTNPAFIVRVVDEQGKTQYAATCASKRTADWPITTNQPYVDIDPNTPIKMACVSGCNATINPVQIVKWQIAVATDPPVQGEVNKYNLTRQFLDAYGNAAGLAEVVAEFAVDLKFAFTVDTGKSDAPSMAVYAFGAAQNAAIGAATNTSPNPGPQRIRAIRMRVSTRAALADRTEGLDAGAGYVFRYCIGATGEGGPASNCGSSANGTPVWARTRTLIGEVALPNQQRQWF